VCITPNFLFHFLGLESSSPFRWIAFHIIGHTTSAELDSYNDNNSRRIVRLERRNLGAHSLLVMAVQSGLTVSELHKRAVVPRPGAGIISDVDGRKNVWL